MLDFHVSCLSLRVDQRIAGFFSSVVGTPGSQQKVHYHTRSTYAEDYKAELMANFTETWKLTKEYIEKARQCKK